MWTSGEPEGNVSDPNMWKWNLGTSVKDIAYSNWFPDVQQPDDKPPGNTHLALSYDGFWYDDREDGPNYSFVCEINVLA